MLDHGLPSTQVQSGTGVITQGTYPTAAQALGTTTGLSGISDQPGSSLTSALQQPLVHPPNPLASNVFGLSSSGTTVSAGQDRTWGLGTHRPSSGFPSGMPPALSAQLFGSGSTLNIPGPSRPVPSLHSMATGSAADRGMGPRGQFQPTRTTRGRKAVSDSRPLPIKQVYVVPDPNIEILSRAIKFACAETSLLGIVVIRRNYTSYQVDTTIRQAFPSIDFDLHAYE